MFVFAGVRWLAWWLVLKAVCCVFLVVVISGVFSSVVVNNSLRLVRLEAAVCSTLSASLRCVLNSESSKTVQHAPHALYVAHNTMSTALPKALTGIPTNSDSGDFSLLKANILHCGQFISIYSVLFTTYSRT